MLFFRKTVSQSPQSNKNTRRTLGSVLFLLSLLIGFYLTFPDSALKQSLISQFEKHLPARLELDDANLLPILTVSGKQARVYLPDETTPISLIDSFTFSPQWLTTITGDPGIKGDLHSASGQISFHWQKSGELGFRGNEMPFEIPLQTKPPMRVAGTIKTAEIETEAPLKKQTESLLEIALSNVTIRGLEAISGSPDGLQIGNLFLQANGQGNAFTIKNFQTSEGDLLIKGQGTLILSTAAPIRSRINFDLTVTAGKSADPTLSSLLEFAGSKQSDGSRKLRLSGTLASPTIR
jgi:type II secretion system protein N